MLDLGIKTRKLIHQTLASKYQGFTINDLSYGLRLIKHINLRYNLF